MQSRDKDITAYIGELIGTFILVFFGLGSVHVANLTSSGVALFQVAAIWGMGLVVAITVSGPMSGAHLNPAITLAFAKNGDIPGRRIIPYIIAQFIGAFLAAVVIYSIFSGTISQFEAAHHIVRGMAGSSVTCSLYGEYFPKISIIQAMLGEGIGTLLLAIAIFSIVRANKLGNLSSTAVPVMIGLALSTIIFVVAPSTQAGLNPARDFAPRIFAIFAGWGREAFAVSPLVSVLVYIVAPVIGAVAGQTIYRFVTDILEKKESLDTQSESI